VVVTVEADPARTLGLGADDYLTKPIDRARLVQWLSRLPRPAAEPDHARTSHREVAVAHPAR
jgi:DNA-binding response OmpR family regulator